MKKRIVSVCCFLLVGCATAGSQKPAVESASAPQAAVAAKSARVVGYTFEEMKGHASCPVKLTAVNEAKPLMIWATACARTGNWKQVEELGNRLAMHYTTSPWGPYFLSISAEHAKNWPRARWMAELAVKNAPNEGLALYQLGRIQWFMDERDTALVALKMAVDKNPTLVEAHVLMGQLALLDDKNSDANKAFMKAFERDPKHFAALMGLAEVGFRNRAWSDVSKYLLMAIESHPKSLLARVRLAEGEELAKNNAGALQTYLEIQKLDKAHKLDGQPSAEIAAKVRVLQASVAEEMKKKLAAERQPSEERKVSK